MDLYFVYAIAPQGDVIGEKRVTDKEHLDTCIKEVKWEMKVSKVYVNKAVMGSLGYLTQGDYCGTY